MARGVRARCWDRREGAPGGWGGGWGRKEGMDGWVGGEGGYVLLGSEHSVPTGVPIGVPTGGATRMELG